MCGRDVTPLLRGWVAYFKLAEVKGVFEQLDQWLRRKLRRILWKQWRQWRTRMRELTRRGIAPARARQTAVSGYGPWRSAGMRTMNRAVPTAELREWGLSNLFQEHQRLSRFF